MTQPGPPSRSLPLYQVDAFASEAFTGNPAAVVPLEDDWLPDDLMQAIATENNLSETAFVVARANEWDLRWFTPVAEVDLCGHATLAAAFVLATYIQPREHEFRFQSRSGLLTVRRADEDGCFTMDFPALARRAADGGAVAKALGSKPIEVWRGDDDLMAVLPDADAVRDAAPDLGRVAALDTRGLIITAPGDATSGGADFVSRFFAPSFGIPEDPVTGSAHCLLTPYWAEQLGRSDLVARQLSRRGGEIRCELAGDRVLLTGRVIPYLEGRIRV